MVVALIFIVSGIFFFLVLPIVAESYTEVRMAINCIKGEEWRLMVAVLVGAACAVVPCPRVQRLFQLCALHCHRSRRHFIICIIPIDFLY